MLQFVGTLVRSPVSFGTAAAGGVLAFSAGVLVAIVVPLLLAGASVGSASTQTASVRAVAAEQVAHDQSEQGLGVQPSIGGEQVAHNRSEEGLGNR